MDSSQWPHPQGTGTGYVKSMEEIIVSSARNETEQVQDRKMPKPREQPNCPRCNSSITKFCYYNNYSLTQPRFFCKACRRYWTEGGSLRNVPVGGGSRKNKKSPTSSSSLSSACSSLASAKMMNLNPQNLKTSYEGQDLTLSFPKFESNIPSSSLSAFGGYNNAFIPNLMPDSSAIYSPGFSLQELKPALGVSSDGFGHRYGVQDSNGGRVLFPFADFKQISSTVEAEVSNNNHGKGQGSSTGYWNDMSNGGSW